MPVIKSAIKKLRKDRKREKENDAIKRGLERAIRKAQKSPSKINAAYSAIDRAVKRNIIHKNKAARIKSSLAKLASPERSRRAHPKPSKVAKTKAVSKPTKRVSSAKK